MMKSDVDRQQRSTKLTKHSTVIYSKKNGINQYLFIADSILDAIQTFSIERKKLDYVDLGHIKEHKSFAYALMDGVEIKLFQS